MPTMKSRRFIRCSSQVEDDERNLIAFPMVLVLSSGIVSRDEVSSGSKGDIPVSSLHVCFAAEVSKAKAPMRAWMCGVSRSLG